MYNVIGMRSKGFTLLELLVAIAVLAIISGAIFSLIGQGPSRYARDSRRKSDLEQIRSALELYRNSNTTYPPCSGGTANCVVSSANIPGLTTSYINPMPDDPLSTTRDYRYAPAAAGGGTCDGGATRCVTYSLCGALEKVTSPAVSCGGSNNCGATCTLQVLNP